MARYIDAEELCRRLIEGWHTNDTEKRENIQAVIDRVVTPIVAGMPTADVADLAKVKEIMRKVLFMLLNDEERIRINE